VIPVISENSQLVHIPREKNVNAYPVNGFHSDVCHIGVTSWNKCKYFLTLKDEAFGYRRVFFVKSKEEISSILRIFFLTAEKKLEEK